jgi:hypothetical protein
MKQGLADHPDTHDSFISYFVQTNTTISDSLT